MPKKRTRSRKGRHLTPALSPGSGEGGATYYDSMQSAAAAMDIPKGTLQWAKDQGAPGFKGSRVYPELLLPWLEKKRAAAGPYHGKPNFGDKRSLECELITEKLEALRESRSRERGDWIEWSAVQQWQQHLAEGIKAILRGKLKNELPPKLEGLRAPEIAAKMDAVIADLVNLIREPVLNRRDAETQRGEDHV